MNLTYLHTLGWKDIHHTAFSVYQDAGLIPARVIAQYPAMYRIITAEGEFLARVSGKFVNSASGRQDFPAVGDWVAIRQAAQEGEVVIEAILPRFSKFSRKSAGVVMEEQIVGTNIDLVFIVTALNQDFNPRRIERYLILAWESGANPVIVLNKADLCADASEKEASLGAIAAGVAIHRVSALTGLGFAELSHYLTAGQTIALLGSSGVGKSTIVNRLFEADLQPVSRVRENDGRGRHTTTTRNLFILPSGGLLLDTPGMRELQLWDGASGINDTFQDITTLAGSCRFRDCQHADEPGCAVKEALAEGRLDPGRFQSYQKLQKELAYWERKANPAAQKAEVARWKKLHREAQEFLQFKGKK